MLEDSVLDLLREDFRDDIEVITDIAAAPPHWRGYAASNNIERLHTLLVELRSVGTYLPEAAGRLKKIATDAFLVNTRRSGICRIIQYDYEDGTYFLYSRLPIRYAPENENLVLSLVKERAPDAIWHLYNEMMDGLTDPFGFVGFKNSLALTTVETEIDTYAELPFFERLEALGDPSKIVEILASGGGGYLLIDLNRDMRGDKDPVGFRMSKDASDQWSPDTPVPLFAMLDAWMAVGLGRTQG